MEASGKLIPLPSLHAESRDTNALEPHRSMHYSCHDVMSVIPGTAASVFCERSAVSDFQSSKLKMK